MLRIVVDSEFGCYEIGTRLHRDKDFGNLIGKQVDIAFNMSCLHHLCISTLSNYSIRQSHKHRLLKTDFMCLCLCVKHHILLSISSLFPLLLSSLFIWAVKHPSSLPLKKCCLRGCVYIFVCTLCYGYKPLSIFSVRLRERDSAAVVTAEMRPNQRLSSWEKVLLCCTRSG